MGKDISKQVFHRNDGDKEIVRIKNLIDQDRSKDFAINENRAIEADKGIVTISVAGLAYILVALLNPERIYCYELSLYTGCALLITSLILVFWSYHYLNWFSYLTSIYLDRRVELLNKLQDRIHEKEKPEDLTTDDILYFDQLIRDEGMLVEEFKMLAVKKSTHISRVNIITFWAFSIGISALAIFLLANIKTH